MKRNLKAISTVAIAIIVVIIIIIAGVGVYYGTTLGKTTSSSITSATTPTSSTSTVTSSSKNSTSTGAAVNINFYESLAPSEVSYFNSVLAPEFAAQNPGYSVTLNNLASNVPPQTLATLVQSGSVGVSLFGLDNLAVGTPLYAGDLMNLSSVISTMMPTTLIPSATAMVNYETQVFHGIYFIPFRSNIPLVFYNKTAFSSAGITSPPATDAQLLADAQKLGTTSLMFQGSANTGSEGGSDTGTELYQFMVQDGGNPFVMNSSADVQAMQFVYNMSKYFNPGYTSGYFGTYTGLANGQYKILDYQWPYVYDLLENATFKMTDATLGVYPGPNGTANGNHLLGGDVLVIPKGASNIQAIEKLANFLLSPTPQQQTLVGLSWVAVNSQAYNNLPSNTTTVGKALQQAINTGVFLRNPTPWISQWNVLVSDAFTTLIVNHGSYSSIQSVMNQQNQAMYTYIQAHYGQSNATVYEQGGYAPISV